VMKNIIHSFFLSFRVNVNVNVNVISCRVVLHCSIGRERSKRTVSTLITNVFTRLELGKNIIKSHKKTTDKNEHENTAVLPLPLPLPLPTKKAFEDIYIVILGLLPVGHLRRQLQAGGVKVVHLTKQRTKEIDVRG
jgi:hypothetical protein